MSGAQVRSRTGLKAALIIAGGHGTRFWPMSRARMPKPLFRLDGASSLLAQTVARITPVIPPERIFVIVAEAFKRVFEKELDGLIPLENLIIEPSPQGTAVAVSYGCHQIVRRLGEQVVVVTPADHYIAPDGAFRQTIKSCISLAQKSDRLVLIGVVPTHPETGYGYIEVGEGVGPGFTVNRFVEKPGAAKARRMVNSGKYLWNAGIFIMHTQTLWRKLKEHCPALLSALQTIDNLPPQKMRRLFRALRFLSFDYEVLEKSSDLLVVPARFRWHDIGSWEGLWKVTSDRYGNSLRGNVLNLGSTGVLAHASKRLMVLLGVKDIIAVDTPDAILIADRSHSEDVRKVVEELRRRKMTSYL